MVLEQILTWEIYDIITHDSFLHVNLPLAFLGNVVDPCSNNSTSGIGRRRIRIRRQSTY
jgi:hypothetical protein